MNSLLYAKASGLRIHPKKEVVGTVLAGYVGHRGWLYSVAVHPSLRRKGLGANLIRLFRHCLARHQS
ncbi:GNAT family N-acetyltransferase [Pseudomonas sp. A-RE-19]|uniref:GNAT family N-acetyltransferase n=1 Tax=Pseudomonas sp. A-RE-19 TaxID=2832401 RepID=UPI001CC02991|nr:GNAT family N-acetyltransferase [Pseudomonas sp. A-RE-19]